MTFGIDPYRDRIAANTLAGCCLDARDDFEYHGIHARQNVARLVPRG
ncbi:hypothetical protein J2Y46_002662 [Microbacterium sp. BE35]|nr:hypothetical protein [Microbacterium sp. BE35]